MKLVLDEWIIREVIDTLRVARTTLLGMTGIDSPQEVAKKSANETAITRRISKAIDIIQQSDRQEVVLEEEIDRFLKSEESTTYENAGSYKVAVKDPEKIARHFYELGRNVRKEK